MNLIEEILAYESLSIIGNYKNVGKTTTLNYIIKEISKTNKIIGLTSIGVDGESKDIVTEMQKPRIYVNKGTLIATAKSCALKSDITKEILEVTDINTPLGNVVIFKALSQGYIELAGPSINNQIKYICEKLKYYKADLSIVDGALSRKTLGSPSITDATIFCSGAILNKNMEKALEQIVYEANLLNIDKIEDDKFYYLYENIQDYKVCIVNKDYTYKPININTTLNTHKEVYNLLDEDSSYIVVNGVLTNDFIESFIKNRSKYKNIIILVKDSTKIFVNKETYSKFEKLKGNIKTINKINLIGISINPTSIEGYAFDEKEFINSIKDKTNINVFNVMSENNR